MPEMKLDATTRARYLGIISDETARLERIIGDLLDLARLEGGGGTFSVEDVPVAQLFDRVTARHERACEAHHIRMTASIEPGAEIVRGDRDRLEQALQNLAGNAMRYAPSGSDIRLVARPDAHSVLIAADDDDPGIPAEHLPHIFDRFTRRIVAALDQMDGRDAQACQTEAAGSVDRQSDHRAARWTDPAESTAGTDGLSVQTHD
jgi:signal transduction histidine kinase